MMQRGDWVVPVFNAELRGHKPVLLYWFMMSAYAVFGVNRVRSEILVGGPGAGNGIIHVPYPAGGCLTPKLVYGGGIILASNMVFDMAGRAATPDSVLIFFSTLAMMIYVLATFRDAPEQLSGADSARRWFPLTLPVAIAMYAVMGDRHRGERTGRLGVANRRDRHVFANSDAGQM